MSVHIPDDISPGKSESPICFGQKVRLCSGPDLYRMIIIVTLCILLLTSAASATEYVLNAKSIEQFKNGINYTQKDELILRIEDNVTIASNNNAGIESAAPVTIRSPGGRTLTILVNNNDEMLYGIKAPSVSVESGLLDITVNGKNNATSGNAFGIYAGSGNVTISGGSVSTTVETTGHKNKGIYASRYIVVSGGRIMTNQHGGKNTFGLDGGDVSAENANGGVIISGGYIVVNSGGAATRNIGIDSKSGTVRISGDPAIFIYEDESGSVQNFTYNPNITTISGGNAVVFTSTGGNYTLRQNAVLTKSVTLIPGKTFEIPVGRTLGISGGTYLTKPADTTFLFGKGYGTFEYARAIPVEAGVVVYAGKEPTKQASAPMIGLLAGLGVAVLFMRRK
jgi:hypothetical protein